MVVIALTIGSTACAGIDVEKIGNPTFKPTDFAFGVATLDQTFDTAAEYFSEVNEWTANIMGDRHVFDVESDLLIPGEVHDGFDTELRRAIVANGGILTDVITASQFRGRNFYSMHFTLVPDEDAPLGDSPDGVNVPVIPNEIFPFTFESQEFKNGVPANPEGKDGPPYESLSSLGQVTDENGQVHDFTNLNWGHRHIRGVWGNLPDRSTSTMTGKWGRHIEILDANGNGWSISNDFDVVARRSNVAGDLTHDRKLDMHDLDIMNQNVAVEATNLILDLNGDGAVNVDDVHYWVTELRSTWMGDANLDGEFNSGDFVDVFQSGKYEIDEIALWSEGDWNADERFDSGDFVVAFQDGGYERGRRAAVAAVPEPSGLALFSVGLLAILRCAVRR